MEPVPDGAGLGPDRRTGHRRQGGHRRRVRRSLLLGHRDLHGPALAYTNPDAARDLLHFRHRTLPGRTSTGDRDVAARGAVSWRTINGEEASAYYPAGTAQYHIDADIAHAIDRYVTATGDTDSFAGEGAEMLVELARLFADLGFYDGPNRPRFHIHGVTGPDEYTAVVDDNLYTNVMARFTLRFAADVVTAPVPTIPTHIDALFAATGLADDEVAAWTARRRLDVRALRHRARHQPAGRRLPRPRGVGLGGHAADKYPLLLNFHPLVIYRHQVLKQADVVLATPARRRVLADLQRRNFDYYDPITTGDSSLSASCP